MILKVKDVSKSFGSQQVLKPITFEVGEGERICILGPSGCGKSTLLQMVAGLQRIDSGEVEMAGITVERGRHYVPPENRPINMVFQDYALWPHMTVKQNMEYGMKRRKLDSKARTHTLERLQSLLKLEGLLERLPAQLSGGQQQRVGIARALATEPKLLLMDEPLSNLDVKLRTDMRGELARLLGELSIASLYVTHDRMEAFTVADRILILREGGIDQFGEPRTLFEQPASPWVAQLMGYHNLLSASWAHSGQPVVMLAGSPISGRRFRADQDGGQAVMMLHPESIRICSREDMAIGNDLKVTVAQTVYEGTRWRIIVETADRQPIHLFHDDRVDVGSEIGIQFSSEHTMLYADGGISSL
ncbi:ABC transporter ATP-binding protein [Paenibacillus sp. JCM 10914]|uniref:ABC transporter ATP-binding protein n=1 Tax=Paenibacillus sp. JCM 10914 TaxID=1236974 RepID=UPI0003CC8363|nr:ABC transporter ATP-binding protein [Paenibacillus sp. JCM 10914]GAE07101.1 SN-glycerol-3-phosphate ABC transporter, ATP-binding protein [Paenibacillus sp. JCM 10914]